MKMTGDGKTDLLGSRDYSSIHSNTNSVTLELAIKPCESRISDLC